MKNSTQTRDLLIRHHRTYPRMQIQDLFKFLFQSAFGCEHLVSNRDAAIAYIDEEFAKAGTTAGTAIKNGYGRAFTAIFDSNLTTIITGIILFVVGTGPVRGFAITLTAGVVISMFTAVVVTRLVLDRLVDSNRTKPFKMMHFFKNANYDFLKYGKKTLMASGIIIVVSLAIFACRLVGNKASVLAVDLTGGTSIVYSMKQDVKPSVADIRQTLNAFDNATVIQYQEGVGDRTLLVKTGETSETEKGKQLEGRDVGAYVTKLLRERFTEADFKAAERELAGKEKNKPVKRDPDAPRNPNVRSLHHIDDEDYESPAEREARLAARKRDYVEEDETPKAKTADNAYSEGVSLKEDDRPARKNKKDQDNED